MLFGRALAQFSRFRDRNPFRLRKTRARECTYSERSVWEWAHNYCTSPKESRIVQLVKPQIVNLITVGIASLSVGRFSGTAISQTSHSKLLAWLCITVVKIMECQPEDILRKPWQGLSSQQTTSNFARLTLQARQQPVSNTTGQRGSQWSPRKHRLIQLWRWALVICFIPSSSLQGWDENRKKTSKIVIDRLVLSIAVYLQDIHEQAANRLNGADACYVYTYSRSHQSPFCQLMWVRTTGQEPLIRRRWGDLALVSNIDTVTAPIRKWWSDNYFL